MTRFSVYAIRGSRRFITETDDYTTAEMVAEELVRRGGDQHAEVWDPLRPIWGVWRTDTNRVRHSGPGITAVAEKGPDG